MEADGTPGTPSVKPLAVELGGDLSCARCGYNLRGLSIRGVCPECATPVRATILTKVDPLAQELRALSMPRVTAGALVVWGVAPVLAALAFWWVRLAGPPTAGVGMLSVPMIGVGLAALSGVAALGLVRPHAGLGVRNVACAAAGVLLYVPLVWGLWTLHAGEFAGVRGVYGFNAEAMPERVWVRVVVNVSLLGVLLLLRPNARALKARSMLLRAGRVDRQTLLALAAVVGVLLLGDVVRLVSGAFGGPTQGLVDQIGQVLTLVGSILLTLGLVGAAFDTLRVYPVLVEPALTLERVVGTGEGGGAAREAAR